jgi:hypothetical protein
MLSTMSPISRFFGKPLTKEEGENLFLTFEVGNLVTALDASLDDSLAQFADVLEIDSDDFIRRASARQHLLRHCAAFLLQREVADIELIREHFLDYDVVNAFFGARYDNPSHFSPSDEKTTALVSQATPSMEYTKSTTFRAAMCRLVEKVSETINQEIAEVSRLSADAKMQPDTARALMLKGLTGFIAQVGHFSGDVMISESQFDYKNAAEYFGLPAGESIAQPVRSAEVESLRRENNRLKLEVETLRRQKARAEEKAMSAFRYRPSSRNQPRYSSIDDMIGDMIRDEIEEVLGEGVFNV